LVGDSIDHVPVCKFKRHFSVHQAPPRHPYAVSPHLLR
jgi:hypothetical protein